MTDPPLNAPTGFRTGKGVASWNLRAELWKLRVMRREAEGDVRRRIAGEKLREAIL